jgi:uncharacterized membrane protein YgdD (TMEM256/DUF423 family)
LGGCRRASREQGKKQKEFFHGDGRMEIGFAAEEVPGHVTAGLWAEQAMFSSGEAAPPKSGAFKSMNKLLTTAGLAGLTGVALGAFGAHALNPTLTAHDSVQIWHTATLYHLVHAVAALAATLAAAGGVRPPAGQRLLRAAVVCWLAGLTAFSGSLYGLALGGPAWLGPVTPLGGLALLAGWTLVVVAGWKSAPKP